MVRVRTPRERVQALGDESLVRQHFDVESDLNELLALSELIEERVSAWPTAAAEARELLLRERTALLARGDALSQDRIARPSAVALEVVQHARARWTQARLALLGIAAN